MKHYKQMGRQAGMTLIELTVVMLILVGLAGLLLPYVSGYLNKTHTSTGASSMAELNAAIMRYENDHMSDPNKLESLINQAAATAAASGVCTTATANTIYCGIQDRNILAVTALTTTTLESLNKAGITQVLDNNADTANKTFASTQDTATYQQTLATSTPLATVGTCQYASACGGGTAVDYHMQTAFGGATTDYNTTCYDYFVFGVGNDSDLTGTTIASPPVHFSEDGSANAIEKYNRFLAVYQVDKSNSGTCTSWTESAKFMGVAMNGSYGHLWAQNSALSFAYEHM
jgi:type II secretory pathway pseudopilin PulG